ncbi:MAG: acyltransferase family protein [Cyanobacteria bacterium P01_C01_bin.120]
MIRLVLAIIVCVGHLAAIQGLGIYAVYGFFLLSGYGITLVITEKYKGNILAFYWRRIAKLYPLYLINWVLSVGLLRVIGIGGWHAMQIQEPWSILMIDRSWGSPIPQAWAIIIELLFYVLMSFGISTSSRRTFAWLGCSLILSTADWGYYHPFTYSVWFATGAAAYWMKIKIPKESGMAAELSYPVFLSHYLIGALISSAFGISRGWPLFLVAMPVVIAFSWILTRIDRKVAVYAAG